MFTSRAEHRLNLRHDSSDIRLFEKAYEMGLHSPQRYEEFLEKRQGIQDIKELLTQRRIKEKEVQGMEVLGRHHGKSFYQALKDPDVHLQDLMALDDELLTGKAPIWLKQAELDVKYEGYIAKQELHIQRFQKMEHVKIPMNFPYESLEGLSNEGREKLLKIRPFSVGQASRISGVRPSDIALLMIQFGRAKG